MSPVMNSATLTKPMIVKPGGPTFGPPVERMTPKLTSADTGGQFAIGHVEIHFQAGPPMHMHTHEDEMFLILEGSIRFYVGDEIILANAGDVVWAPRNIRHRFEGASVSPAKAYVLSTGDNFDRFIVKWMAKMDEVGPNMEILRPIAEEHGITIY